MRLMGASALGARACDSNCAYWLHREVHTKFSKKIITHFLPAGDDLKQVVFA